ncbi:MAG: uncharacterized protein PWP65_848 [Clostridia bacterium]|nr:uncharacterized protein [Clostridia bacterium]
MTRIIIWRQAEGGIKGFEVKGHAGFQAKGKDIVCAAVSALTQTSVLGLEKYLATPPQVSIEAGKLTCFLPPGLSGQEEERAHIILETMYLGLRAIAASYQDYIQLETRRWTD